MRALSPWNFNRSLKEPQEALMTATKKKSDGPAAPRALGLAGRRVWRAIVGSGLVLRPDELDTLEDIGHIEDTIDHLTNAWERLGKPLTSLGSMRQE